MTEKTTQEKRDGNRRWVEFSVQHPEQIPARLAQITNAATQMKAIKMLDDFIAARMEYGVDGIHTPTGDLYARIVMSQREKIDVWGERAFPLTQNQLEAVGRYFSFRLSYPQKA